MTGPVIRRLRSTRVSVRFGTPGDRHRGAGRNARRCAGGRDRHVRGQRGRAAVRHDRPRRRPRVDVLVPRRGSSCTRAMSWPRGRTSRLFGTGMRATPRRTCIWACGSSGVRRPARLPGSDEHRGPDPAGPDRTADVLTSLRLAPPRMARLCATPSTFPHVDAVLSRARSCSWRWSSAGWVAASRRPRRRRRSRAGRSSRATPAHIGFASRRRAAPVHGGVALRRAPRRSRHARSASRSRSSDGSSVVAVGHGVDRRRRSRDRAAALWSVDRDYGPPCRRRSPRRRGDAS